MEHPLRQHLRRDEVRRLRNFVELPGVVGAWSSIENTLLFALYSVPLILVGALAIALVLARVRHGASIYRFLVYFPVLVPGVVAALIWLFLTNVDFGLFNEVIRLFGGKPVVWLGADNALPGPGGPRRLAQCRLLGHVLRGRDHRLPTELYQAAELDGASALARFRYLTLPLLRRIIFFAIVVSTIWGLQVFDTALVLTNGGPGTATTTVIFRVWQYVFASNNKVGFASAISLVLIVAILALTLAPDAAASGSARRRLMAHAGCYADGDRGASRSIMPASGGVERRRAEFARHLVLALVTFLLVAPFYYVFLASLKNSTAIFSYPPKPAADSASISTTTMTLLWNTGFLRWMFNTLFVARPA